MNIRERIEKIVKTIYLTGHDYGFHEAEVPQSFIDNWNNQLTALFREVAKGAVGEPKLHTHDSIPSFTTGLDDGCFVCIQNRQILEIKQAFKKAGLDLEEK